MKQILKASIPFIALGALSVLAACGSGEPDTASGPRMEVPWETVAAEAVVPSAAQADLLREEGITQDSLADAGMPVLVPGDAEMLRRLELNAHSHLYAAYIRMPDYVLTVTGIRLAQPRESQAYEERGNVGERRFYRWGSFYTVRVDCEITDAGPEDCDLRQLVDAVTDDLILINPRP